MIKYALFAFLAFSSSYALPLQDEQAEQGGPAQITLEDVNVNVPDMMVPTRFYRESDPALAEQQPVQHVVAVAESQPDSGIDMMASADTMPVQLVQQPLQPEQMDESSDQERSKRHLFKKTWGGGGWGGKAIWGGYGGGGYGGGGYGGGGYGGGHGGWGGGGGGLQISKVVVVPVKVVSGGGWGGHGGYGGGGYGGGHGGGYGGGGYGGGGHGGGGHGGYGNGGWGGGGCRGGCGGGGGGGSYSWSHASASSGSGAWGKK